MQTISDFEWTTISIALENYEAMKEFQGCLVCASTPWILTLYRTFICRKSMKNIFPYMCWQPVSDSCTLWWYLSPLIWKSQVLHGFPRPRFPFLRPLSRSIPPTKWFYPRVVSLVPPTFSCVGGAQISKAKSSFGRLLSNQGKQLDRDTRAVKN